MQTVLFESLQTTATHIIELAGKPIDVALVLGSGMHGFVENFMPNPIATIPYNSLSGMPADLTAPAVEGHALQLYIGNVERPKFPENPYTLAIMDGRFHCYQGYSPHDVVHLHRALVLAGAKTMILNSAVGAVNPLYKPGDLVIIRDHANFSNCNPLLGVNDKRIGPQFPDQGEIYDQGLIADILLNCSPTYIPQLGFSMMMPGPYTETPFEIQLLGSQQTPIDVVGMSMPPEAATANQMGIYVAGIGFIVNMGAGLGGRIYHEGVLKVVEQFTPRLTAFLSATLLGLNPKFLAKRPVVEG